MIEAKDESMRQDLRKAVDLHMLLASSRMTVLEQLDGKSEDYIRGLFDGIEHQTDFIIALLSPVIERIEKFVQESVKNV